MSINDSIVTKESIMKKTYISEISPLPSSRKGKGGTSRRQVTPLACLYGREKIAKEG